ncbi:methyltransferase domain-containing protein [Eubacteriaceae bacterium ES3]|nr:methyltransferase domain-containing protein [Eubacteriaceae bacterium ES3]
MNFENEWREMQELKDIDETRKFWDFRAEEFNEIGKRRDENDAVINMLLSKGAIFKGARVLDIGCGAGRYSKLFLKAGCEVTGIDISPNMIDFSKENANAYDPDRFIFKVM